MKATRIVFSGIAGGLALAAMDVVSQSYGLEPEHRVETAKPLPWKEEAVDLSEYVRVYHRSTTNSLAGSFLKGFAMGAVIAAVVGG